jgi:hypothetical protein
MTSRAPAPPAGHGLLSRRDEHLDRQDQSPRAAGRERTARLGRPTRVRDSLGSLLPAACSTTTRVVVVTHIATLTIAAPAVTVLTRGRPQRGLDAVIGLLGAWMIVASMVFGGLVITWLGFASGVALIALALAGLTLHELSTERVVHSFEVRAPERELAGTAR